MTGLSGTRGDAPGVRERGSSRTIDLYESAESWVSDHDP